MRLVAVGAAVLIVGAIPAAGVFASGTSSASHPAAVRSATTGFGLQGGPSADIRLNSSSATLVDPYFCDGGNRCSNIMYVGASYRCSGVFVPLRLAPLLNDPTSQTFSINEDVFGQGSTQAVGYREGSSLTCDGTWHYENVYVPLSYSKVAYETNGRGNYKAYFEATLKACDLTGCTTADHAYSLFIKSPRPK
jgi:hypothetical protein